MAAAVGALREGRVCDLVEVRMDGFRTGRRVWLARDVSLWEEKRYQLCLGRLSLLLHEHDL